MIAILGGLGAALAFAAGTLCNSRSSRLIGPSSLLAWIMVVGLVVLAPALLVGGVPGGLDDGATLGWLALGGAGNVVGLGFAYAGLRAGKVGIVAPVISTQGAIAALIAVAAGERIETGVAPALAVTSRLRLTRRALPLVVAAGLCEVGAFGLFALGARHGIAVTAVLAAQFGVFAAVGAFLLFRERLARAQVIGVATVVAGVTALALLQA